MRPLASDPSKVNMSAASTACPGLHQIVDVRVDVSQPVLVGGGVFQWVVVAVDADVLEDALVVQFDNLTATQQRLARLRGPRSAATARRRHHLTLADAGGAGILTTGGAVAAGCYRCDRQLGLGRRYGTGRLGGHLTWSVRASTVGGIVSAVGAAESPASGSQSCQPSGMGGHAGSGFQPGGGTQLAGGWGHPGGGLKRVTGSAASLRGWCRPVSGRTVTSIQRRRDGQAWRLAQRWPGRTS